MRRLFISLIKGYRLLISPFMAQSCRFHPSCSSYAIQAIEHHGVIKGCWLATKRLSCCHPFHPGGYDPVPEKPLDKNGHTAH